MPHPKCDEATCGFRRRKNNPSDCGFSQARYRFFRTHARLCGFTGYGHGFSQCASRSAGALRCDGKGIAGRIEHASLKASNNRSGKLPATTDALLCWALDHHWQGGIPERRKVVACRLRHARGFENHELKRSAAFGHNDRVLVAANEMSGADVVFRGEPELAGRCHESYGLYFGENASDAGQLSQLAQPRRLGDALGAERLAQDVLRTDHGDNLLAVIFGCTEHVFEKKLAAVRPPINRNVLYAAAYSIAVEEFEAVHFKGLAHFERAAQRDLALFKVTAFFKIVDGGGGEISLGGDLVLRPAKLGPSRPDLSRADRHGAALRRQAGAFGSRIPHQGIPAHLQGKNLGVSDAFLALDIFNNGLNTKLAMARDIGFKIQHRNSSV